MKIMVSACLVGENCKYNGGNNRNDELCSFLKQHDVFLVCPEVMGGLSIPRTCCEIKDGKVIDKEGNDKTYEYVKGAKVALEIAKENDIDLAILQARSPSCGHKKIYDGTFSKRLIDGNGIFCDILIENGFKVMNLDENWKKKINTR